MIYLNILEFKSLSILNFWKHIRRQLLGLLLLFMTAFGGAQAALEAEERGLVTSVVEDALLASTARRAAEAALREAWEELGIHERDVTVIGPSDTYRTGSGYAITPVIAVVPPDLELNPSPTEVAQWFEAPVDFVFDAANHTHHSGIWQGQTRSYIEILWEQHRIWGVTAAIIANLAKRIAW